MNIIFPFPKFELCSKYCLAPLMAKSGVTQGSVLSAKLFLIFINNILDLSFHEKICAFAAILHYFICAKISLF